MVRPNIHTYTFRPCRKQQPMYLPDTFFFLLELPLLQMAIRSHHPIKNVCVLGLTVIIYANKSCLQPEAANKVTTHGASRYFKFKAESQARNWLPGISLLIISICMILLGIKAHCQHCKEVGCITWPKGIL